VQETVVLLVLLVLGSGVLEELAARGGIGDGVRRAGEEQERGDELGRPAHHRLLRGVALVEPAGSGDVLVERVGAGGVLDLDVAGELLGLERIAHGQTGSTRPTSFPARILSGET